MPVTQAEISAAITAAGLPKHLSQVLGTACAWVDRESTQVDALKVGLREVQTGLANQSTSLDIAEDTLVQIITRLVSSEAKVVALEQENTVLQCLA